MQILDKAEEFMQPPLSICFGGCDKHSPWWDKHPPVQKLPLTVEFYPVYILGLSSLFSFSAVLVRRDDTAWEWRCWWKGRQRQNRCGQYSRNPVIKCAAVSVLLSVSFGIALVVLYFHCAVRVLFVQTPFFYNRRGDSVLMAFVMRLLWIKWLSFDVFPLPAQYLNLPLSF